MNPGDNRISIQPIEQIDSETLERANSKVLLLPDNWSAPEKEPVYAASTESLRKLFVKEGVAVGTLTPVTPFTHLKDERALDWMSPVLLVTSLLITQNPQAVTIALNVISNYVTEILRCIKSDPKVRLTIIRTATNCRIAQKINYEGPVSGLDELSKVLARWTPED